MSDGQQPKKKEESKGALLTGTDIGEIISHDLQDQDENKLIISSYDPEKITPVGYDLRVGRTYTTSNIKSREPLEKGDSFFLKPNSTALISTLEEIRMPKDKSISGLIQSKVSQVSKGLSHISTTVDPDYEGHLLIAVHNHSTKTIEFKYGDAFCTIVFIKNLSPSTCNSKHNPDRLDIFLNYFTEQTRQANQIKFWKDIIPPGVVIIFAISGYLIFGNKPGFIASVACGVAISQFVERRYLR